MSSGGGFQQKARWLIYVKRFGRKWAEPLVANGVMPPPGTHVDAHGQLIVPGLRVALADPGPMTMALLRTLRNAIVLTQRANAEFEIKSDHILIRVDGIRGVAVDTVDINVFHEVFVERLYAFEMPGSYLVLDIGMNIGLASLFFAKHYQAEVHAFELVPSTASIASRNIDLNQDLKRFITVHPYGLADKDQELQLQVSPLHRAGNSLIEPIEAADTRIEHVTVKDISPILADIQKKLDGRKLVLKMDAEGAEYEMVERLASTNQLADIDILFLEWHERTGKKPDELRSLLRDAGFLWFERDHPDFHVGMISAYRK